MATTQTIHVPLLGGIDVGFRRSPSYDVSKPTLILVNSFTTSSELYDSQFNNEQLTSSVNLLAIELLGHGKTRCRSENWTYWDSAAMNLQVMEAMKIEKAFVLGTSQGGWVCVRMALLAPEMIEGIIPVGTSLDYESERTRKLGCWDGVAECTVPIMKWTTNETTPEFEPDDGYCNFLCDTGFGMTCSPEVRKRWHKVIKSNYRGDEGRRRARMCAINLRDRDGLHARLFDVRCPVLWMHGTSDAVYSVANAKEEIKLFVNSANAELRIVQDGAHFLSASHPEVVDPAMLSFIVKWHNKK